MKLRCPGSPFALHRWIRSDSTQSGCLFQINSPDAARDKQAAALTFDPSLSSHFKDVF